MFDADRPIVNSTQDKLNRTTFAKYLARCMLDHHEPDSLVIGLYGGWGAGKTSVINLTLEELHFAASNLEDDEKPIILNFSVWSYSGEHDLIYSFFRRLSSAIRGAEAIKNREHIIHLLELYVSFFTQKPVPGALRPKPNFWQKITGRHHDKEEVYGWESGRDLTLVKAELNELLRDQKHKLIIIIDNISRLYPREIRQLFQIVKSMGDYANTVYLLAMDKPQVMRALDSIDVKHSGEEFVEKIVQLPFEIPPISQQDLEKIFADRVNEVVHSVPEDSWDREYWADIYYESLKYFFDNCRDITRYVNTLNFGYPRLRDVVNPVDFFALTAIESFLPPVYAGIRDNKDLFTDLLDNVYVFTHEQLEKDKLRCDEILARNNRVPPDALLSLLFLLFPRIRHIYHPNVHFYYSDARARRLRRICSPDLFDAYFRLSMQNGQLPNSEFETILGFAVDHSAFDHALNRLNQDDRISAFLNMLDSKVLNTVPRQYSQTIVSALLDNGDLFPQGVNGPLSLDTPMRIHRIIHRLLQRFNETEERFIILQNAIAQANNSLYILVYEIKEQEDQHHEASDTFLPLEFCDLKPEELNLLRKLVVSRIANWAHNDSLADHPRLIALLYAWRDWGNEEDCRRFVKQLTDTDRGLLAFLTTALEKSITNAMTRYEKTLDWQIELEHINAFIPARLLEPHAKLLFEDNYFEKLREREQLALMIFLDLTKTDTTKIVPNTSG